MWHDSYSGTPWLARPVVHAGLLFVLGQIAWDGVEGYQNGSLDATRLFVDTAATVACYIPLIVIAAIADSALDN